MCTVCASAASFDQSRADAFVGKLLGHLNGAALMMMCSIGHRTGLFDVLSDGVPRTSSALADAAGLSERYVREWLGAMTTGGITTFDAGTLAYALPAEHAAFLTRAASPNNFAITAQWVSVLGGVEDHVVDAFAHGKGVAYENYGRFNEVMAEESSQTTIAGLHDHILPLVPEIVERLAAGGARVVDIGCGAGRAIIDLAARFPRSTFLGLDLQAAAVEAARRGAADAGVTNAHFAAQDLTTWNGGGGFDLVTAFDAIHDQARPDLVLRNIRGALRPDGIFLMQDIKASSHLDRNREHPLGPFLYTISTMHCMSVSLAQGGMGLGAAWGQELAQQMLREAGFSRVTVSELPHDIINDYYVCRA